MATNKRQNFLGKFIADNKQYPILAAIAAGSYPILFYYSNNYTLINTWSHLAYFVFVFLLIPIVVFVIAHRLSKLPLFSKWRNYVLPFLNIFVFLFLLKVCLYAGIQKKISLGILIIAVLFALFLYKHFKKLIVIQLILVIIGVFTLVPIIIKQLNYSKEWMRQPDDIEKVVFKKKPNVYFIQPDGYTNFSELKKGVYNIDNIDFENFLKKNNFKNYDNFRSNYASTLSSNSSTFMMKHHHYNRGSNFNEALHARNIIISKNTVLDVFKKNNYKTYFITEMPYLLLNRPKLGYDNCNFSYSDISYIGSGFNNLREIKPYLVKYLNEDIGKPKFFFIEMFNPGHIQNKKRNSEGLEKEKEKWANSLLRANSKLKEIVSVITDSDDNALIIIMADHGGFVGFSYAEQVYIKTQDRKKIYSMFSSILTIHWPNGLAPEFDNKFKSSVNVFRILFSYLSEEMSYLSNLQPDDSYMIIYKGAPKGIYQYIDGNGKITFKKH